MDCTELLARFTDYMDGSVPSDELRAMEEHLAGCSSCRRYRKVLEDGSSLLKSLPEAELREDFAPRLQHRLYHVQEERVPSEHVSSGAPALTVLGIAVLLAAVAWAPVLRGSAPVVQLQPIVVDRAPSRLPTLPAAPASSRIQDRSGSDLDDMDIWDGALLYEYSTLHRRYQGPRQVGLTQDR